MIVFAKLRSLKEYKLKCTHILKQSNLTVESARESYHLPDLRNNSVNTLCHGSLKYC